MHKSIGRHRRGTPGLVHTPVTWEPSNQHRSGVDVATILGREAAEAPLDPTVGTVLPAELANELDRLTGTPSVVEPLAGPFPPDDTSV